MILKEFPLIHCICFLEKGKNLANRPIIPFDGLFWKQKVFLFLKVRFGTCGFFTQDDVLISSLIVLKSEV